MLQITHIWLTQQLLLKGSSILRLKVAALVAGDLPKSLAKVTSYWSEIEMEKSSGSIDLCKISLPGEFCSHPTQFPTTRHRHCFSGLSCFTWTGPGQPSQYIPTSRTNSSCQTLLSSGRAEKGVGWTACGFALSCLNCQTAHSQHLPNLKSQSCRYYSLRTKQPAWSLNTYCSLQNYKVAKLGAEEFLSAEHHERSTNLQ